MASWDYLANSVRAIKEPPETHAKRWGLEAIKAIRAGLTVQARDAATTAAHFARLARGEMSP